jgi:putative DNA primase/helicase
MNAESIAQALGKYKRIVGGLLMACCPVHDDHDPSLSIKDSDNGGILVKCFAGCPQDAVIAALKERGLWPAKGKTEPAPQIKPKVVARYHYRDQAGNILYWKERLEPGKGGRKKDFRFRYTDPATGKDEFGHGKHNPHVLYNLDKISAASIVHFHEGEKQADVMAEWGLVGTTLDCGAQSRLNESLQQALDALTGKNVALYPDNDEPGNRYMETVAAYLHGKAKQVKIINLPGLPNKGDVCDWINPPGNNKELFLQCMADAPYWEPTAQPEATGEANAQEDLAEQFPLRSGRERWRYRDSLTPHPQR